ncbi:hypothetical protein [Blastomonas aquatica]|uniref:hypothetical protein n=1 Tax=Blastomonas aquatica TaxID=1510276 RepID=UPI003570BA8C
MAPLSVHAVSARIAPNDSPPNNTPSLRAFIGDVEVGAALGNDFAGQAPLSAVQAR